MLENCRRRGKPRLALETGAMRQCVAVLSLARECADQEWQEQRPEDPIRPHHKCVPVHSGRPITVQRRGRGRVLAACSCTRQPQGSIGGLPVVGYNRTDERHMIAQRHPKPFSKRPIHRALHKRWILLRRRNRSSQQGGCEIIPFRRDKRERDRHQDEDHTGEPPSARSVIDK